MLKTKPFENYSERYDAWFEKHKEIFNAELNLIQSMLPPHREKGIEIGVGSGQFAEALGIKKGVEPAEAMALKAESKGIKLYRTPAENLPFNNNTFEFILMITTVCFLNNIEKAFSEAHRVLRKNGSIVIGFVNKNSFLGKKYSEKKDRNVFYKDAVFYSPEEISDFLKNACFKKFEYKETLFTENLSKTAEGFGEGSFTVIKAEK